MPRIFLSHSKVDAREAIALKRWLAAQDSSLRKQIFLDVDYDAGMVGGERWRATLRRNLASCQALLCLVSKDWEASKECHVEFVEAEGKGKTIFCVRLDPEAGLDHEIATFQRWDLFVGAGQPATAIDLDDGQPPVLFSTDALMRLLRDIRAPDLGADSFTWPPPEDINRAPYRGWLPYEPQDAAVFFGRDAELASALHELNKMHDDGRNGLFVILGPSGTGKSSFLRAGILPRVDLQHDRFTVLDIVRPGRREALSGEMGFAKAVFETRKRLGLVSPAFGEIRTRLINDSTEVRQLLIECQQVAKKQSNDPVAAPTLILPLDQAEELFSAEAGQEAVGMLRLMRDLLAESQSDTTGPQLKLIVAATIRTDRYEEMQTAEELSGIDTELFNDLKPMRPAGFPQVIEGPARRSTDGGRPLSIQHRLVNRLLDDATAKSISEGGDALPLLSGTLARLFADFGDTGELTVEHYEQIGGIAGVVETEINKILSADPAVHATELDRLKEAFIPWLATMSESNQPMRRIALWTDLPEPSRPLIEKFVEARILIRDNPERAKGQSAGQDVVEIALESFLRQWHELSGWLGEEAESLKAADVLLRDADRWEANDRHPKYLYRDPLLADAEKLAATETYARKLLPTREFLVASREQVRRQQRRRTVGLTALLALTVIVAIVAVALFFSAHHSQRVARQNARDATSEKLVPQAQAMLAGTREGDDVTAFQVLLAANKLATHPSEVPLLDALSRRASTDLILNGAGPVVGVAFADEGHRLAVVDPGNLRVWDTSSPSWRDNLRRDAGVVQLGQGGRDRVGCTQGCRLSPVQDKDLTSLAIAANGQLAATGTSDGTVLVWNLTDQAPTPKPVGRRHQGRVTGVALSRDGSRLASAGVDGIIDLSNPDGSDERAITTGHEVFTVAFSPSGDKLAAGGADGAIRIWNVSAVPAAGGSVKADNTLLNAHADGVTSVAFSPKGDLIASGGADNIVKLWRTDTLKLLPQLTTLTGKGHTAAVTSVAFSADGNRLVSGGNDETVQLWDVARRQRIGDPMKGHRGLVLSVAFVADGDEIVSGGNEKALRFWNGVVGQPPSEPLFGHNGPVTSVAISTDGREIVSGGVDGTVRLWDSATGTPNKSMPGPEAGAVTRVALNRAGDLVASATADGKIRLWQTTNDTVTELDAGGPVSALALTRDGHHLASAGLDGQITLWELPSRRASVLPNRDHAMICDVAFDPNGDHLASGGVAGIVRVWDLSGRQLWEADAAAALPTAFRDNLLLADRHPSEILGVAFSPDGNRVAAASTGWSAPGVVANGVILPQEANAIGVIQRWESQRWESGTAMPYGEPTHVGLGVMGLAFSSDARDPAGERIVAGGFSPYSVQLWNPTRGEQFTFPGHQGQVVSVAVSIDGGRIVSGSDDGTVRIWPNPPTISPADALCGKLTTTMSTQHWAAWVSTDIPADQHLCPNLPPSPPDNQS